MALIIEDVVRETTTTTGTGAIALAGVRSPGRTFASVMADGDTCHYAILHTNANEWEIGLGTYATSGNTLTRTTIFRSSNSNAAVNFTAGTKNVDLVMPAQQVLDLPLPNVLPFNYTLRAGRQTVVAAFLQIPSGFTLTLGANSYLLVY